MKSNPNVFTQILKSNLSRERNNLSKFACRSNTGLRARPDDEKVPDRENIRPSFFHDTDKIIHSKSYTRYIDKTQVFYLYENDHITHRVLHVQFVSKIARVIGRALRLNEDLLEAISLGHDLGHVPYGHDGEAELNILCNHKLNEYFCHNAQSVRFLKDIDNDGKGLNLTLQVLDGILAHNGEVLDRVYEPSSKKTWDDFEMEYKGCFKEKDFSKKIVPMTLEGCVMRISDIIAYIGRDIEDAIELKIIKKSNLPKSVTRILGDTNDSIINKLVMDLIEQSYGKNQLIFSQPIFNALDSLKNFNYKYIYHSPQVKRELPKVKKIFELLFDNYLTELEANQKESDIFKYFLNQMNDEYRGTTPHTRMVVDFISGMTDDFFNNQFQMRYMPRKRGYQD